MSLMDASPSGVAGAGVVGDGSADVVVTPTVRGRLRANRGPIAIGLVVLLAAVLIALAQGSRTSGALDPDATDPLGSHAVAALLGDQGVTVVRVTDTAAAVAALSRGGDATLVIDPTAPLSDRMASAIQDVQAKYTVLLAPQPSTLDALAPWATPTGYQISTDEAAPGCDWYLAVRAGPLPQSGGRYSTDRSDIHTCWAGGVLDTSRGGAGEIVTVVGLTDAFTNAHLADSGNASMSLGILGRTHTVVWWLPSSADPLQFQESADISIQDLVPSWVGWALLQVALAMVVVVWWRGRRLGRIVVEPLPVVVRATESVEGRARLYRRGRSRGRAADALRTSTLARLRALLSLPRGCDVAAVIAATSARTGRSATDVAALITPGTDPTDDAGLTGLADALDTLENEVRRS